MELSSGITEHKRSILRSTSKRVRMIFSVMASPNRIDILRILNSKGPLTYSELKSLAGFKSKKESGKFAYHLRKLLHQSLVSLNRSERRYTITNLGKLVLSLARQIEERSIIESGKMYVRTSHQSIEEFNSHKIIQSLVREGNLPLELAQKITEEAENHIYKYQITYLTGSLIRDVVNSVLLEHGHEEYRTKLTRLGLPVFDLEEMLSNMDSIDNGVEGLLQNVGRKVFSENLILNKLPKDVADSYLSGYSHVLNPGLWILLPDTIFVNIIEIAENGIMNIGGKFLDVTRIACANNEDSLFTLLSIVITLLSKEASQEVVVDDLVQLITKYFKDNSKLEQKLLNTFSMSFTSKYNKCPSISFRIKLQHDQNIVTKILSSYKQYVKMTPIVTIGLIIDYNKTEINKFSLLLSEIITLGGQIMFSKKQISNQGIIKHDNQKNNVTSEIPSIKFHSLTINLPRLALESNKDETYFRARLALLMKPAIMSMKLRKKDVSDLIRRGLTPIMARNTQYMQRSSTSLIINLVGLNEAVFNILGYDKNDGKKILYKVIYTAVDVATKKGKEINENVNVSMIDSQEGVTRFAILDGEKYGKNSVLKHVDNKFYSAGISFTYDDMFDSDKIQDIILEHDKLTEMLNGGLLTQVIIDKDKTLKEISKLIECSCEIFHTFKLTKPIAICGNCGFKDGKHMDKCVSCNSPYIIE